MPLRLLKLSLTNFRNYEALRLDTGSARQVVLFGSNGAGKTNILEAVSLLAPGKGLRGAELADLTCRFTVPVAGYPPLWAVSAEMESAGGHPLRLGTGLDKPRKDGASARRLIRLDGKEVKSQRHLSSHVAAVWLTPQMDRIFLEGTAPRRRFLDRLVFACVPDHVTHLNRYEKNLRQRLRLLCAERAADPLWLDALESQIAADGVAVAAARLQMLSRLAHHLAALSAQQSLFPVPSLQVDCPVATLLDRLPALQAEQAFAEALAGARTGDRLAGRSGLGVHRADFIARYAEKDMPAAQCSTGEQKGLLLSIILAHARMVQADKGFVPLLLLDEVAAHLDAARRAQLFAHLEAIGGQVWLTGTDAALFGTLKDAAVFSVSGAQAVRMPERVS